MIREKIIGFCGPAIRFCYYALIFFLPVSIALCETFSGIIIFLFLLKRFLLFSRDVGEAVKGQTDFGGRFKRIIVLIPKIFKPADNYLNAAVSVFILLCALSITQSHSVPVSLAGFFFKVLEWTYLYFIFVEYMVTKQQLKIFIRIFVASVIFICINGLVQKISGRDFIFGEEISAGRINSSFRHANDFGGYLALICPFLLALLMSSEFFNKAIKGGHFFARFSAAQGTSRIFLLIVFILAMACLGWTLSRGAWLGFFTGLLFLGLQKKRYFVINCIIGVIFLAVFSPALNQVRQASLLGDYIDEVEMQRLKQLEGAKQKDSRLPQLSVLMSFFRNFSGSGRGSYWQEAIITIRQSPVLGSGINTYSQVAKHNKISWGGYPHNCYLQMAAEIGLVGLSSFLWIIVLLIRNSLRNLRRMAEDDDLSFVLIGILGGLVSFWVHSFFDTNFYSVQLGNLMWVMIGLAVAAQKISFSEIEAKAHA